jgi:hypothetical protein
MSLEHTEQGKLHLKEGASGSVDRSCCLGLTNVTGTSALITSTLFISLAHVKALPKMLMSKTYYHHEDCNKIEKFLKGKSIIFR